METSAGVKLGKGAFPIPLQCEQSQEEKRGGRKNNEPETETAAQAGNLDP